MDCMNDGSDAGGEEMKDSQMQFDFVNTIKNPFADC